MAKRGRKNKYETVVKPNFPKIIKWLENGATERQVAQNLGVGYSTFEKYKAENLEFQELIKNSRCAVIQQLRGALIKRAVGFEYKETKVITEEMAIPQYLKEALIRAGFDVETISKIKNQRTETMTKLALPDVAALNLALKNYDADNWANDPQMLKIREKELELREKQIDNNSW